MSTKALSLRGAAVVLSLLGAVAARAEPAIVDAAMNGDLKAVRTLVRQTGRRQRRTTRRHDGPALGRAAARSRHDEPAAERGRGFQLANRTGAKPFYLAAVNGDAAAIGRLLDAGEDANAVLTAEGESVLMLTAYTGNPAAVKLLLERGADPNTQQFRGQTALMWAAAEGHADVVRLLLERGADPALSSSRRRRSLSAALRAA